MRFHLLGSSKKDGRTPFLYNERPRHCVSDGASFRTYLRGAIWLYRTLFFAARYEDETTTDEHDSRE